MWQTLIIHFYFHKKHSGVSAPIHCARAPTTQEPTPTKPPTQTERRVDFSRSCLCSVCPVFFEFFLAPPRSKNVCSSWFAFSTISQCGKFQNVDFCYCKGILCFIFYLLIFFFESSSRSYYGKGTAKTHFSDPSF